MWSVFFHSQLFPLVSPPPSLEGTLHKLWAKKNTDANSISCCKSRANFAPCYGNTGLFLIWSLFSTSVHFVQVTVAKQKRLGCGGRPAGVCVCSPAWGGRSWEDQRKSSLNQRHVRSAWWFVTRHCDNCCHLFQRDGALLATGHTPFPGLVMRFSSGYNILPEILISGKYPL